MYRKITVFTGFILLLNLFLLVYGRGVVWAKSTQTESTAVALSANVELVTSDSNGITFDLQSPPPLISPEGVVSVAGLWQTLPQPGAPALPFYATYLILPPSATVDVQVTTTAVSQQHAPIIQPVPQVDRAYIEAHRESDSFATPPMIVEEDTAVYDQNALYPPTDYTLSEVMHLRDYRLVELRLYPLRYNPVQNTLAHAAQMQVAVSFVGSDWSRLRPSASNNDTTQQTMATMALNYEQAKEWRSVSEAVSSAGGTPLPIGVDTYKIEVNQDGIYEVSGAELAAAGMNIANVDPATIEMMHRGQSVAYQLIGSNGDNDLDPNEKIRFYGWVFEGPRTEEHFIKNNVFWLWAGGTPTLMTSRANEANTGHPVDTDFWETITREPENHYFATWTDQWPTFPNEPDDWYWDYINKPFTTITRTYTMTLPNPVVAGPAATYLAEFHSRRYFTTAPHIVRVLMNSDPTPAVGSWYEIKNVNVSRNTAVTNLLNGTNTITIGYATPLADQLYLNRLTVAYMRQLTAVNNQLIFTDEGGGAREFQISGYTQGNANNALVYDVTVPTMTVQINMSSSHIIGSGPYTYKVGSTHTANEKFMATTTANVLTAVNISQYTPPNLDPASGGAEWLAINHSDFMAQANQLATHRSDPAFGGMSVQTVDVADVINQYGYGLPLPAAIQRYLQHALNNWTVAPSYVTLFGDATQNPRNLNCPLSGQGGGCSGWDQNEVNFLLTDLVYYDRWQGQVPSDYTFVLLDGPGDELPDMAIGRIPAKTAAEAAAVVNKIILFEQSQLDPANYDWLQNILFVADNYDPAAGNFCNENEITSQSLPNTYGQTHLCLLGDPPLPAEVDALRVEMSQTVHITGTSILNYRGHGARDRWTGENPPLMNTAMSDFWQNDQPFMVLSADCLDGHFAWPGVPSLGEVILKLDGRGSVAHWGSSGLGLTSEHSVLHKGFYDGMFDVGFTAVGDAVNYAKLVYENGNNHHSELYSFNLQGDPAMQLFRPDLDVRKRAVQNEVDPGDPVDFRIDIRNDGLYPAHVVVTDTLPSDLTFVGAVASAPVISSTVGGNQIRFEFLTEFNLGETFAITVTANTMTDFIGTTTNWVTAVSTGLDINLSNNTTSALITSTVPSVIVTNYAATPLNNEVQLDWETSQELNILSYKVERAVQGGSFVWLNQLGVDGYIPAQGNPGGFTYQEFDTTAHNGFTYLYRLKAIQENQSEVALGTRTVTLSPQAQLTDFNATPLDSKVPLDWTAVSEYDLDAYHIERGQDGTFTWLQDLGQGGYINATGGLTLTASYLVTDTTAVNGQTYTYRLMAHQALTPGANIAIVATRTVTLMDLMLVQFDAEAVGYDAQLTWQTQSEINVGAFRIERGQNGNFVWLQTLGDNGYIPATGGAITADYLVTDTTAAAGKTYTYRLIAVQAEPGGYETNLAEDTVTLQYLTFLPFLGRP